MDAIQLLIDDHKVVKNLFEDFDAEANESGIQAVIAEKICKALTVHTTLEEELFYPEVRQTLDQSDQAMLDDALQEHAEAKKMIAEIMTLSTGDELTEKMHELQKAIEHHVHDEEDKMFPKLRQLGMEVTILGIHMERRKAQLMSTVK